MKNKLFGPAYAALFHHTGEPTLRSSARLRAMQSKRIGRSNPNIFYATVDPRPEPKVTWSYNTQGHFARREFTYNGFFAAIHPFWLPLYAGMAEFAYRLIMTMNDEDITRDLIITASVPLKNEQGKYFWYNQVSFPGTFDKHGLMIQYLNEFHRLAEFDRMVPSRPALTNRSNPVEEFDLRLKEEIGVLLEMSLRQLLSRTNYKVLDTYRLILAAGRSTGREMVANSLGVSVQALDKVNGRLLSQARLAFPAATLTSVVSLAKFLNDYFGAPRALRGEAGG